MSLAWNFHSAIQCFASVVEVSRKRQGQFINGRYDEPVVEKFEIRASVQPMTPTEMFRADEGRRLQGSIKLYTTDELLTSETSDLRQPDLLDYNDHTYQVESVQNWNDVAGYYKVVAVRAGQ